MNEWVAWPTSHCLLLALLPAAAEVQGRCIAGGCYPGDCQLAQRVDDEEVTESSQGDDRRRGGWRRGDMRWYEMTVLLVYGSRHHRTLVECFKNLFPTIGQERHYCVNTSLPRKQWHRCEVWLSSASPAIDAMTSTDANTWWVFCLAFQQLTYIIVKWWSCSTVDGEQYARLPFSIGACLAASQTIMLQLWLQCKAYGAVLKRVCASSHERNEFYL